MRTSSASLRPMPLVLALAFLLVTVAVLLAAEQARPDSVQLDAIWKGKKIGQLSYSISEQPGEHGPLLRTTRSIKFSFRVLLLLKITVEAWEETLWNEDGAYSFYRQGKVRGHKAIQKGYYDGSKLVCDSEIDGKTEHKEFADSLFDHTSLEMEKPAAALSPGEEKTVRVLNLENLKVHKRTFRCLRYEDLYVGDDTVACKVFGNSKENTLEWITRDSYGVLIKQEEDDPHAVSLRPVAVIWKQAESQ